MPMYLFGSTGESNAETSLYSANRLSSGSPASSLELFLIDRFITQGKNAGWWDKVVEFYPWLGNTVAGVSVKAKYYSVSSCVLTGFSDSDFNDPSLGIGTDNLSNTSKYVTTGFFPVPAGLTQSNMSVVTNIIRHVSSFSTGNFGFPLGIENTNTGTTLPLCISTVNAGFNQGEFSTSSGVGVRGVNYGSGYRQFYKDHSLCNQTTGAMTSFPNSTLGEFKLFRQVWNGAPRYATGRLGSTVIASFLSDAEYQSLYYSIRSLDKDLGRIPESSQYVFFGDSITAGQGSDLYNQRRGFAYITASAMGLSHANMGIPSSNTGNIASPLFRAAVSRYQDIFQYSPEKVFILYGTNDQTNSRTPAQFETDLTTVVNGLINPSSGPWLRPEQIVLCSPPYRTPISGTVATLAIQQEYLEKVRSVATSFGCIFVDLFGATYSKHQSGVTVLADTTHPNDAGHLIIANTILQSINGVPNNLIGVARGVDLNVTNIDRAIWIEASKYKVSKILLAQPSTDISASSLAASIRTASGGGGSTIVTTVSKTGLTGTTTSNEQTIDAHSILSTPLYFRTTTSHGSAASVDVLVYGEIIE